MENEKNITQSSQPLDILAKRILTTYTKQNLQLLFEEKRNAQTGEPLGIKEPVTFYIYNAKQSEEHPVQCIQNVIFSLIEPPTNVIICNSKSRVQIKFKVFLLVKFQDVIIPSFIVLPDDISTKCITLYDLTIPQKKNHLFPKEMLQVIDNNFVYTIDIPLSEFTHLLTPEQLADPSLQSYVFLKNLSWNIDIDPTTSSDPHCPSVPATTIKFSLFQNMTDKIVIDQTITIEGIPENLYL
jgi:hypothetical protein